MIRCHIQISRSSYKRVWERGVLACSKESGERWETPPEAEVWGSRWRRRFTQINKNVSSQSDDMFQASRQWKGCVVSDMQCAIPTSKHTHSLSGCGRKLLTGSDKSRLCRNESLKHADNEPSHLYLRTSIFNFLFLCFTHSVIPSHLSVHKISDCQTRASACACLYPVFSSSLSHTDVRLSVLWYVAWAALVVSKFYCSFGSFPAFPCCFYTTGIIH